MQRRKQLEKGWCRVGIAILFIVFIVFWVYGLIIKPIQNYWWDKQNAREKEERERCKKEQQEKKRLEMEQKERERRKNELTEEDRERREQEREKFKQIMQQREKFKQFAQQFDGMGMSLQGIHQMWMKIQKEERKTAFVCIATIDKMDGHKFECYCANLLQRLKFINVEVTKGSGDQGVDIIAEKGNVRYAIQCKRYASSVGNSPVQEVNAGMQFYHCDVAVVLTNQHFTAGAKQLAEATGVLLWDRNKLIEMIKQANLSY